MINAGRYLLQDAESQTDTIIIIVQFVFSMIGYRVVIHGWFSLYLLSLFHYEINSFVVSLFLRLFLFDSHYTIKYFHYHQK